MEGKSKELFEKLFPAIESKKNEFRFYGYQTVTEEEIWDFCVRKKWRKKDLSTMRLHEIVHDLFKLSPAEFMTYTQIEEQRHSEWFSELNQEELQLLLSPKKVD